MKLGFPWTDSPLHLPFPTGDPHLQHPSPDSQTTADPVLRDTEENTAALPSPPSVDADSVQSCAWAERKGKARQKDDSSNPGPFKDLPKGTVFVVGSAKSGDSFLETSPAPSNKTLNLVVHTDTPRQLPAAGAGIWTRTGKGSHGLGREVRGPAGHRAGPRHGRDEGSSADFPEGPVGQVPSNRVPPSQSHNLTRSEPLLRFPLI